MSITSSRPVFRHPDACPRAARGLAMVEFVITLVIALGALGCNQGTGFPAIKSTRADAAPPSPARADGAAVPDVPAAMGEGTACLDPVICCVGPGCPKRPAGAPCQNDGQCQTGSCADGVCCNVPCRGACVSCNQADRMGECLPTAAGQPDPHLVCRTDYPASCGQSGVCNGQGGCAKYNAGVPCGEPSCDGLRVMVPASECDGEGRCIAAAPIACAPFLCEGSSCRVTCTTDAHCQAPQVCISGSCGLRGRGQTCTSPAQCASGFCADGVCCDSACSGKCSTCSSPAARGRCVPVPAGTRDPRASRGITDPALVCLDGGAQNCGSNGRCDGRGGCETYADGTTCAAGRCDQVRNVVLGPSVCRTGRCEAAEPRSCAPFVGCEGARCSTRCVSNADCAGGNVCLNGSCGKRPIGSICSQDSECAGPGVCAQGRCCATACSQTCMACNLEGAYGTCSPVAVGGADPAGMCRNDACSSGCDGKGGCRREREGTTCGASVCMGGGQLSIRTCSATGLCQPSTLACPTGQACQRDRCLPPKRDLGGVCASDDECASGACVGGNCCATACTGPCKSCSAAGGWRCLDRPPESECGADTVCRSGQCVPRCPASRTICGTTCADLYNDADNCGACGTKCESRMCSKGVCAPPPCAAGLIRCGTACVAPQTDAKHCGGCDRPCHDKDLPLCVLGRCSGPTTLPPPSKPDGSPGNMPSDAGVVPEVPALPAQNPDAQTARP
jgi:hypothetical protein